jgi:predicted Fe-S protein YdhL (DUF1289 family)
VAGASGQRITGVLTVSVASPCINVCRLDPATGWCEGCARSIDEIAAWGRLDDAARRAVLQRLPSRRGAGLPHRFDSRSPPSDRS